jgi:glycosyltransferase involved in cell wall biosynthesis
VRVGIVTTVYNHAKFLPECLESVAAQTDHRYFHVVVVDASPDNAAEIAEWYASDAPMRRAAVLLTENRGLAGAFHAGVNALPDDCDWILKVDADDKIDERYVAEILRAAAADPRRNVIFAPAKHFGARRDVFVYPEPYDPARMIDVFYIPGPAGYRRSLWDAVGGYDLTMRSAEDWDFYIRAERAVGLVPYQIRVDGLYWWYRMHDGHRASSEGMKLLPRLQQYWRGHTRETALARSRTWAAWLAEMKATHNRAVTNV